jgi:putative ABC transport system ATP-binding protein
MRPLVLQFVSKTRGRGTRAVPVLHDISLSVEAGESETQRDADELFEKLGLVSLRGRYPPELPCGEEQCVAVARALVHRPAVLRADEPTGNLDFRAGQVVAEGPTELARLHGSAVVVAAHDTRIASCATRRIGIEEGRIIV